MRHDAHAHDAGAYVLGALDPPERRAFEDHLHGCAECTRAVGELAGVPGLLARVDDAAWRTEAVPPPPETLLPRLLGEVRRTRRRRAGWALAGAAAALAVVTGGVVLVDSAQEPAPDDGSRSTVPGGVAMRQVGQEVVSARLAAEDVPWGTRLELTCRYDAPVGGYGDAPPPTYSLVVRTVDGRTEQVATWQAVPGRTVRVGGATATARAAIRSVEVRTAGGDPVLVATF